MGTGILFMKIKFVFLIIFSLVCASVFTFCKTNGNTGDNRLNLENFQIFSGTSADRERLLKSNFESDEFKSYNRELLINDAIGGNYHVFKTYFTMPEYFLDKNLSLYIDLFDMPVVVYINDFVVYKKGLRPEIEGVYSTGETAVSHVPLESSISFDKENKLIIEVFPQFETNSLPEIS